MLKEDIIWPESYRFKSNSDWEPAGFFSECLCNSYSFDLMLGFFSSSAINVLADGFATFLYNGGKMRMIINDILTEDDKNAIIVASEDCFISAFDITNLEELKNTLSERDIHFFECISWLIRNNRIEIKVIAPISGNGIAHTKCGVFYDGINRVAFDGSVNFSRTALLVNKESLTAMCDWNGQHEIAKIRDIQTDFETTFSGMDKSVKYIDANKIKDNIVSSFYRKEIDQLLEDEIRIINNINTESIPLSVKHALANAKKKVDDAIKSLNRIATDTLDNGPRFPYSSNPRPYQVEAFNNWKENKQKGLFAMATGTGKTITSLNCLLEIYKHSGYYKAIILVPTITLVEQWENECKKFNFEHIYKVFSKNPSWKNDLEQLLLTEQYGDDSCSYIIISTYASFIKKNAFDLLTQFSKKRLLFIADEAHNMGSGEIRKLIKRIPFLRRIGLSATPKRMYDEEGNSILYKFFGAEDGYTYEYSMKQAIENGFLCKYYYYPHIVELNESELLEYVELSEKIARNYYSLEKDCFINSDPVLTMLLLKRKRIVHKASNKKEIFKEIIQNRFDEKGKLDYTLVYVPEGNEPDYFESDSLDDTTNEDIESAHLIDQYTSIISGVSPYVTVRKFTSQSSDRDSMIEDFSNGKIQVLTSMKCLDEGVDVPRSEMAIFCSSTGNPRQFIQRRGRILRTHPDKQIAIIHDLIVSPKVSHASDSYHLMKSLVKSELIRVREFALLSENPANTILELQDVLNYYGLNLFNNES